MLGVLCGRPRPWLFSSLPPSYVHASAYFHFDRRFCKSPIQAVLLAGDHSEDQVFRWPTSIWHSTIIPSYWRKRWKSVLNRRENYFVTGGGGSWNVAWDTRPARWPHHPDLAWMLFGGSDSLISVDSDVESNSEVVGLKREKTIDYRVTGVVADGRCLFRAIAHMACLKNEGNAPDENRQRELADELRAQVVQELLKRREEVERFIDEDFDAYVARIQQPYVWGGEPELLMASHVLRTPISVFMKDRSSGGDGGLSKVTDYGGEYAKEDQSCISVLFQGYGHYDILEFE